MRKGLIRIGILAAVFILAVLVFEFMTGRDNGNMMQDLGNATLPSISFVEGEYTVNTLNGYTSEMKITTMRDSITPITNNQVIMKLNSEEREVTSIDYTVYNTAGTEEIYSNTLSKVGTENALTFEEGAVSGERVLVVTLHTDGMDINYYTRIVDSANLNLASCMDYVYNYHENALIKAENTGIGVALEPSDQADNTTLAHVTIQNSFDQVTWGDLEPKVTGKERWTIKETNSAYTSIMIEYDVNCVGEENDIDLYTVQEFFRVRNSEGTMYLLNYDRTMDQVFDGSKKVIDKEGLILGITNPDVEYKVNKDGTIVAFVQANELWLYNRDSDELSMLFSFRDAENTDDRNKVSDHVVRILSMSKDGNVVFAVTGYMNRGDHEGQVGMAVYSYDIETNSITEKLFVPSDNSPEITEKEMGEVVYYSAKRNYLYVLSGDTFYEIDVHANWEEPVADDLEEGQLVISENSRWVAYQAGESLDSSNVVIVKDLSTGDEHKIKTGSGESIIPIGFVNDDFVCGFMTAGGTGKSLSGSNVYPMSRVEIRDPDDNILETYTPANGSIVFAEIDGNMISMELGTGNNGIYTVTGSDYIANSEEKAESNIMVETYTGDIKQTEVRITYADGISDKTPKVLKPKQVKSESIATPEFSEATHDGMYFVYGLGRLQEITEDVGWAIQLADSVGGVVMDVNQQYVWERGNRYLQYSVSGQDAIMSSLYTDLRAGVSAVEAVKNATGGTVLDMEGCTVEEMLYLVNWNKPVVAVLDQTYTYILTSYDAANVTYYDAATGTPGTVTYDTFNSWMKSGVYVSYMP